MNEKVEVCGVRHKTTGKEYDKEGKGKMKRQIVMEYRKMWNKVSIVAVIAMCLVTVVHLLVYLNLQYRAIDKDGRLVEGLASYRALLEASKEIEGVMDGEYIKKLKTSYDGSYDKAYLAEHRGFLGTGGMTKYMVPNYFINYAYYGAYMSNGNDKVGLDYDFLDSEKEFYDTYKRTVKEHLAELEIYSEKQLRILEKKADRLATPYKTGYYQGLANLRAWFILDYELVFVALAFCLSGIYTKDHAGGVTELALSSRYGRRNNLRARWIAGNLFAASIYLIYLLVQVAVNGFLASLSGWDLPAQMFWFSCLHNITIGEGLLFMFAGGLCGGLVVGNLVLLISIVVKNRKFATAVSVIAAVIIMRAEKAYGFFQRFNPFHFKSDALIEDYLFIGEAAVPYFAIVFLVTAVYVAALGMGMKLSAKKYRMN